MATAVLHNLGLEEVAMPGDNHCFFNSVVHQKYSINPGHPDFSFRVQDLRDQVVLYLQANMYSGCFLDPLYHKAKERNVSYIHYENENLTKESAVLGYLTLLSQDEWADNECIASVCALLNVKITIISSDTGRLFECGSSVVFNIYVVYYTGSHYNSVRPKSSLTQVMYCSVFIHLSIPNVVSCYL